MKHKPKSIVYILLRRKIFILISIMAIPLGLLFLNNQSIELKDEPFCSTNTDLYQTILSNVFEWVEYFPDKFPQYADKDLFIFFQTPDDSTYVVHAVYWTTESGSPIFYVPLATQLRRNLEIGKYGLFYTPSGELPKWDVTEYYHLANQIYCYRLST
jgi:hypothetical protein